ncbi:WxL protein peptidoglycan domain-containing protein [Schleiferilactobacillus perolens]|uniref:WxL protein peptidoglycan domain-containing protein n=2 Tax=Schleiferilactobacillus perolens TaxID=100468 RepID=UPI0023578D85|nr:DUF916 domain-containing protein [Schleiferilactobacillus perolens]MCI2171515.1 DUF916 and DUF3324 domain-containing protein [Schleiferilactobacillus perolens]
MDERRTSKTTIQHVLLGLNFLVTTRALCDNAESFLFVATRVLSGIIKWKTTKGCKLMLIRKKSVLSSVLIALIVEICALLGPTPFRQNVSADISSVSVTPMIEGSDVTDRFQLIVKPGQTRKITVSFTNFGSSPITLAVVPRNAATSGEGKIVYSRDVSAGDSKLRYAFKDITKRKYVKMDPQQTKDVTFTLKIPQEKFIGLLMGGLYIYDQQQGEAAGTVAVPVWLTETNRAVGGSLVLTGIETDAINQQPYVFVNLANTQPGIMKNVVVHMKIQRKGILEWMNLGLKPMTADLNYDNVAPNSIMPVGFNQKQTPIKAGKYVVDGTAKTGKTKWKFGGTFNISKAQADKVNKASKNLIYDYTWAYLLGILALFILIIIVVLFIHRSLRYKPRHLATRTATRQRRQKQAPNRKKGR